MPTSAEIQTSIDHIRSVVTDLYGGQLAGILNNNDLITAETLINLALLHMITESSSTYPSPTSEPILSFPLFGDAATGGAIKAAPGKVYSMEVYSSNTTSTRFLQLFNRTTAPPNGTVPIAILPVFAGGYACKGQDLFTNQGLTFSTGIAWGFSTTPGTFTPGVGTENFFTVRYS